MKLTEVDVTKMVRNTNFTANRIIEAFEFEDTNANNEMGHLFRGSTLRQAMETYDNRTFALGGNYEDAAIRRLAQFFPKE